jgi:two-component system, OmpR family, alkaline phosphatase synthesis response regulator PhoP
MKILVVDDEPSLCEILQFNLEIEGFEVDVAYSAEQALNMNLRQYSLILLDVMMGQMSGFKMAQILKKSPETSSIPIIFCTAKDTEDDTVAGLTLGADDYISKPFSIREVVARVKSVLRRSSKVSIPETPKNIISCEGLFVDLDKKVCVIDGNEVLLTKKEMEILVFFLKNNGRIFSREEILAQVWPDEVIVLDRTIDVNITRLRKKIGNYGKYIITRLGYGYGFKI